MTKPYAWLLSGITLMGVGLMLAIDPVMQYWRSTHVPHVVTSPFSVVASAAPAFPAQPTYISGVPVRLQLPSLHLDLPVINGYYNKTNKTWTLTNDKVQFASSLSPDPNNKAGNTFLYGHNRPGVFKTLSKLNAGDRVIITTSNGHTFTYVFRAAYQTEPDDASVFSYVGSPILTIQTCSGVWFQHRQMFTFDLQGVQ